MMDITVWADFFEGQKDSFAEVSAQIRKTEKLFEGLPLPENWKKKFKEEKLKEKAAFFSALCNVNIDNHFVVEFLKNKKSRNILLNRETEAFITISSEYYKTESLGSLSEIISLIRETKATRVADNVVPDLFSTVPQEKSTLQKAKQKQDEEYFFAVQELAEDILFPYNFDKVFIIFWSLLLYAEQGKLNKSTVFHVLNILLSKTDKGLVKMVAFEKLLLPDYLDYAKRFLKTKDLRQVKKAYIDLIGAISKQITVINDELKSEYRNWIGFDNLMPRQRIAANYLWRSSFCINKFPKDTTNEEFAILNLIYTTGFLSSHDIGEAVSTPEAAQKAVEALEKCGLIIRIEEAGEVYWIVNTKDKIGHEMEKYGNRQDLTWKLPTSFENKIPLASGEELQRVSYSNAVSG